MKTEIERDISSADAVHKLVNNRLGRKDFNEIKSKADENTELYKNMSTYMNEIRTLNSTRYIYTATRNEDGRLIYVVDGLDPSAGDVRHPGDPIEKEMVPYIEKALSGKTVYSQDIVDTTWGPIFTACYPVTAEDESNEVIGVGNDEDQRIAQTGADGRNPVVKRPNRYPGQKRHEYRAPDENFQPHVQVYQADGIQGDIGAPVIVQNDRGKEQKDGAKQIIDKKAGQHPLLSDTAEHADNHKQRQQHRFEKDIKRENVRRGEKTGNHADKHQGKNHQRLAVFFVVSGAEHTDQNGGMHGRN